MKPSDIFVRVCNNLFLTQSESPQVKWIKLGGSRVLSNEHSYNGADTKINVFPTPVNLSNQRMGNENGTIFNFLTV